MTMLNKGLKPVLYDKDKAVSPIIATILLVAITVILASTLYLALGGFFSHTTTSTPTVSLGATNTTVASSNLTYTITTGALSGTAPSWSSTTWVVTLVSGTTVTLSYSSGIWTGSYKFNSTVTYTFEVFGQSGNTVASGQSLTLYVVNKAAPSTSVAIGPSSVALMDISSTGGGQMGTVSL